MGGLLISLGLLAYVGVLVFFVVMLHVAVDADGLLPGLRTVVGMDSAQERVASTTALWWARGALVVLLAPVLYALATSSRGTT